ncbi:ADP-ribosyl-[dinitrogen reductase] glycohydrolase [Mycobacterium pseudokansasii]|nr:ADP-ribosyl-[dinitrogen reductase] glycohydrolase [Mycobacterium pseudokansasii]VAZ90970.1 ADP-ribosyl-[dinitrogen reductase] glycohydrolase [Mycobacterium pseudokansasii]
MTGGAGRTPMGLTGGVRLARPHRGSVPRMSIGDRKRFRGCLLGGAVGDALGAPVEFHTREQILARFGPEGITAYAPAYGGVGMVTDDTQMTLFTAEGLLRYWVRGRMKGLSTYTGVTANAYLRWLRTQGEAPVQHVGIGEPFGDGHSGWLYQQRQLHSQRAPGNTCISALRGIRHLGEPAENHSKGCGGVMRVAPVGLFVSRQPDGTLRHAFRIGTELAALTHGHPTGSLSAGVFAALIYQLALGIPLAEALPEAKRILVEFADHDETLNAVESAEAAARRGGRRHETVAGLGQGWVADEALAIGVYCALTAESFEDGIVAAVNHDGDSDSTGSIAGNLLGATLGVGAISSDWLEPLELRDVISEIADDLYDCADWHLSEYSFDDAAKRMWHKYPGY